MTNHLVQSNSPYLLQHAENPVEWYPWGTEAFEKARTEDKPIFLSIGYAACHWCHVMAHESFEDAATAALMNEVCVNIKVDREERPDLDSIYMSAVVALTGQGGWPMSVFMTSEGIPFSVGLTFPSPTVWEAVFQRCSCSHRKGMAERPARPAGFRPGAAPTHPKRLSIHLLKWTGRNVINGSRLRSGGGTPGSVV